MGSTLPVLSVELREGLAERGALVGLLDRLLEGGIRKNASRSRKNSTVYNVPPTCMFCSVHMEDCCSAVLFCSVQKNSALRFHGTVSLIRWMAGRWGVCCGGGEAPSVFYAAVHSPELVRTQRCESSPSVTISRRVLIFVRRTMGSPKLRRLHLDSTRFCCCSVPIALFAWVSRV